MAHCAEIDQNGVVLRVIVVQENYGNLSCEEWCEKTYGGVWKKTSYNTRKGEHPEGRPFRKNYATVRGRYDAVLDAFIPPKPEVGGEYVLDERTCYWEKIKK